MIEGKSHETPTRTEQEWLSVEQFRLRHSLGKNLVYDAVRQGRLKSARLGGKILIAANALALLAESQTVAEPDQEQEDE